MPKLVLAKNKYSEDKNDEHNRSLLEKRDYIRETLDWFDVPNNINKKLAQAKNITISDYLDECLIPALPKLLRARRGGWNNVGDMIQFRGFISLCFRGDLSQKAWDILWESFQEDEQIFYSTTYYYLGYPLEIAAHSGNLAALKRLDAIYQRLLPKHPERFYHMHLQLRQALLTTPKYIDTQQHVEAYNILLDMCERYATFIKPTSGNTSFSNKQFNYHIDGLCANYGVTPLLDVFSDVFENFLSKNEAWEIERSVWVINQLSHYVRLKGTEEDFEQFKTILWVLLEDKYSKESYQEYWKALDRDTWDPYHSKIFLKNESVDDINDPLSNENNIESTSERKTKNEGKSEIGVEYNEPTLENNFKPTPSTHVEKVDQNVEPIIQLPSNNQEQSYTELKKYLLQKIDTQINKWDFNFFLFSFSQKRKCWSELKNRVKAVTSEKELKNAFLNWKGEKNTSQNPINLTGLTTYEALGQHRNIFFSKDRPTVKTSSQLCVEEIEKRMNSL